ncbi:MAG TPA: cytochrome c biogenesis protein CcdA [Dehalococcoidia bacterium]|nr:cytochrome c biogenesis protein CcdA [Dehalococcoidia bacterium]
MSVNTWFAPFVAFLAGLVSFVSPCVLPLVPVYLAEIAGDTAAAAGSRRPRHTFAHAASFVAGFSAVFIALGASVGLLGYGLRDHQRLLAEAAGVLVIVMGLHLAGIIRIPLLYRTYSLSPDAGAQRAVSYTRSALIGGAFALGWTPCIGPVLGGVLSLAAVQSTALKGAALLVCYSLGLGVPFLIAGLAVSRVVAALKRLGRYLHTFEVASGVLLVFVGVLLLADRMTMFNQYFDFFGLGTRGL